MALSYGEFERQYLSQATADDDLSPEEFAALSFLANPQASFDELTDEELERQIALAGGLDNWLAIAAAAHEELTGEVPLATAALDISPAIRNGTVAVALSNTQPAAPRKPTVGEIEPQPISVARLPTAGVWLRNAAFAIAAVAAMLLLVFSFSSTDEESEGWNPNSLQQVSLLTSPREVYERLSNLLVDLERKDFADTSTLVEGLKEAHDGCRELALFVDSFQLELADKDWLRGQSAIWQQSLKQLIDEASSINLTSDASKRQIMESELLQKSLDQLQIMRDQLLERPAST